MQATRIGAGLSTDADTEAAATGAAARAREAIGEAAVDLAVVFASRPHMPEIESLLGVVREHLDPRHLIGCCAQGVVGTGKEVEEGPGPVGLGGLAAGHRGGELPPHGGGRRS